MSDDLNNAGPQDDSRVNATQPYEVLYWTTQFRCTEQQLREAVAAVGVSAVAVRAWLVGKG